MASLRAHNILDYLLGAIFILAPWIFGMTEITTARYLFVLSGSAILLYSLLTNYYYSLIRKVPLGVHMTLDSIIGVIMILSPALFGYRDLLNDAQYAIHMLLGIVTLSLVALTRPRTEAAKTPAERAAIANDLGVSKT